MSIMKIRILGESEYAAYRFKPRREGMYDALKGKYPFVVELEVEDGNGVFEYEGEYYILRWFTWEYA